MLDSFQVIVHLFYRYKCYKPLQMVVSTYQQLGSMLVDSSHFTHALASLQKLQSSKSCSLHWFCEFRGKIIRENNTI